MIILVAGLLLIGGAAVLLGFLFWGGKNASATPSQTVSILFVGNSYTFGNDLPAMFAALAKSGGHEATTGMSAQGGLWLADHVKSAETNGKIQERNWDYVFLQEQSVVPSHTGDRTRSMYPAARQLVEVVRANNSTPVFFMTWGRRDGLSEAGHQDFEAMQTALVTGYMGIANELNTTVAPVGIAWREVRRQHPEMELYIDDGSHPNVRGSYLAACVFYAVVFQQSPEGLSYDAKLPEEEAAILQRIAAETVLPDLARWHVAPVVSAE